MSARLGVMQPYFFPYLGYWQLIDAVDDFIIYDDVQYIKSGYINRNRIILQNEAKFITLILQGASSNKMINEIEVGRNQKKMVKSIQQGYAKAPYFKDVMPLIESCILFEESNLGLYLANSITEICNYLKIETSLHLSSALERDETLDRTERLIHFCKHFNSKQYINALGGQELYDKDYFASHDIELSFIDMNDVTYDQFNSNEFISHLSIIDIMMFNSIPDIKTMLGEYKLV